ncbi:hypothetical protein PybrP1_003115 [[Pythium] brassicae (nom. inval.)]|nr:hypothetical protein PybrP1_003115 [[Pythium] brassicae (nom. inval.)]
MFSSRQRWCRRQLAAVAALVFLTGSGCWTQDAVAIVTRDDEVSASAAPVASTILGPHYSSPGVATSAHSDSELTQRGADEDGDDGSERPELLPVAAIQVTESLAEEGRGAGVRDYSEDELESVELPPSLFEIEDRDSGGGRRQNYASLDAGATILDSAPEVKSPTNLLVPDKDRYMLIPCEKARKWVVVSLSEDVHADAIALANFEKFSSPVKDFLVLGSVAYPTDTWFVLGNFTAAHASGEQVFQLESQSHVRYIKLRFFSHYGSEYYCTLSQLKVFGRTFTQVISQLEKSIDAEAALDSAAALPAPPPATVLPSDAVELSSGKSDAGASESTRRPADGSSDGDGDGAAAAAASASGAVCRPGDDAEPVKINAGATTASEKASPSPELSLKGADQGSADVSLATSSDAEGNATVASASTGASDAATANAIKANATPAATTAQVTASVSAGASPQGLGRLESIFVRITKKIQALELNQSVFGRQMEEFQAQQRVATRTLQANQDAFAEQLKEIRSLLTDLKGTMSKELSGTEKTLDRYGRVLEEVQRENIALWNEMLVVREVITTMKAGILCAIVLSAFIITFYLLRLLFRCVAACKQRADLREWFWRMENQASAHEAAASVAAKTTVSPGKASGARSPTSDVEAGDLRVNRKQQFGSSWDDSAIERKTLMSDMVDGPQRYRRHRSKKSRTASLTYGPTIQRIVK